MGFLLVVGEALAVVGSEDNHRVFQETELPHPVQQAADPRVHEGDLGVVRRIAIAVGIERRRLPGTVGIEVVNEEEEGLSCVVLEEAQCGARYPVGRALFEGQG
jgi:hypothetical protein